MDGPSVSTTVILTCFKQTDVIETNMASDMALHLWFSSVLFVVVTTVKTVDNSDNS